ncbi:MAG: ankyrin repeat domain-containing protein [Betaproteobacteria bacterium]|nr:ankyrin repeat domain-containing protein [Betaproteobacteria bacterium]
MRGNVAPAGAFAGCVLLLLLLTGCASVQPGFRALDVDRLHNAIVVDDVDYVQAVIGSRAASPNQRIPAPGYMEGTPLLTIAARSASLSVLRYLIAAGANVNARTPANETALMLASFFPDDDDGRNPPSYERHERAVRLLVEAGADLENDPVNYTPLSYAAYQGHEWVVRFLLERGARVDADAQDSITYINTPLMMAAMQGHERAALRLLRARANARIRVKDGLTAAELAAKYNHERLARALVCAERLAPGESFAQKCE